MHASVPVRPPDPAVPHASRRRVLDRANPSVTVDAASDEELLGRAARGDVDGLATLYDRHRSLAYGVALRVTGSVPLAEDVLQEAFLAVWRQAGSFDPARGSARAWLLAIVHHRAVDGVRRRRAAEPLPEVDAPPPPSLVAPDLWPEVAGRLDAEAVRRALATLPTPQREAIELAYWGGLTQVEIAAREQLPLGTVKGRMRLGLQALARALRDPADPGGARRSPEDPASAAPASPADGRPTISRLLAVRLRLRAAIGAALRWSLGPNGVPA